MPTWQQLSSDSFAAAKLLLRAAHWRSCVSRFYYSAYSAITSELAGNVTFARGWNNPAHEVLLKYIDRNMRLLSREIRKRLKTALRRLYNARTDADYFPQREVDEELSLRCHRDAHLILDTFGVPHD